MHSRQDDCQLANCSFRLAVGFLPLLTCGLKFNLPFLLHPNEESSLPGEIVTIHFVLRFQVPKLVDQINKLVPVVHQKRLQIAEPTIFNDH